MDRDFKAGDIVSHFKRQYISDENAKDYLYEIIALAKHSETGELMVVYKALYGEMGTWVRPYDMFMGKVDKEKYPDIKQEYRFEKV